MPELGEESGAVLKKINNSTYGLAALEALVDDLESRLTAARAGYLDNISQDLTPLLTRLSAARAAYLDNLNNAKLLKLPIFTLTWFSTATIAAASTAYIASIQQGATGGRGASEATIAYGFLATRAGTLKNLVANAGGAAGAGESFIYTVRINGVATTITCTISGASDVKASDSTHTATVAIGDRITIEVVTSTSAAAVLHTTSVEFEGV